MQFLDFGFDLDPRITEDTMAAVIQVWQGAWLGCSLGVSLPASLFTILSASFPLRGVLWRKKELGGMALEECCVLRV